MLRWAWTWHLQDHGEVGWWRCHFINNNLLIYKIIENLDLFLLYYFYYEIFFINLLFLFLFFIITF